MHKRTFGPSIVVIFLASASQARMSEISFTNILTSFELVELERNWLSLARSDGCCDTWTLGRDDIVGGSGDMNAVGGK